MLVRLALEQFLIFESAVLEMGPGLQVLTGEAGAGKSILVDALGLVAGERASADWIRAGAERLVVEAAFDLSDDPEGIAALSAAGIPHDDDCFLLLRREVGADGRSRAFANGRQVLVSQLREWTASRVRIVGQGEQRALLSPHQQEDLLDRTAGSSLAPRYRSLRRSFLESQAELERLREERRAFANEEEWLRFQAQEIDAIDPKPGEREQLLALASETRARAETGERVRALRARLRDDEGSIADHLESLLHELRRSEGAPWSEIRDRLLDLRESVRALERLLPPEEMELEFDPETAAERRQTLDRLVRKYGGDEEAVRQHRIRVQERLDEGTALAARIETCEGRLQALARETYETGDALSRARQEAALRLCQGANEVLASLGMAGAELRFEFRREESPDGARPSSGGSAVRPLEGGLDHIALRFRSHPSLPLGDLGRTASGGELSRVLLALHSTAGETATPGSWIFDEIDAGIGGETAVRVGERLGILAERTQVLLVTHLPVIAARAHRHFRIVKEEHGGRPRARVELLEEEDRLRELARMLSGDDRSEVARRHARELRGVASGGAA
jgi:DNA repair protein RecN (Recombination protein N)